jgi:hypothetical protein
MIAEIGAGLSSLNAALDLAKGLNATATQATINDVKIELQQRILDAQGALHAANTAQSASADRIRDLEQQIVQLKDWETEKEQYELKQVVVGIVAYMPKPGVPAAQTPHYLCANCFEHGRKRYLQRRHVSDDRASFLQCNECKADLKISGSGVQELS